MESNPCCHLSTTYGQRSVWPAVPLLHLKFTLPDLKIEAKSSTGVCWFQLDYLANWYCLVNRYSLVTSKKWPVPLSTLIGSANHQFGPFLYIYVTPIKLRVATLWKMSNLTLSPGVCLVCYQINVRGRPFFSPFFLTYKAYLSIAWLVLAKHIEIKNHYLNV